jgi:hypothetical protein
MIQTRKCIRKKESERCDRSGLLDVPKNIAAETTMKMMHEEVEICRRYVCHKEMCI